MYAGRDSQEELVPVLRSVDPVPSAKDPMAQNV